MEMDQGPLGGDPVPWLSQLPRWSVALLLCALNLLGNTASLWIGGVNFYFNGQNGRKMVENRSKHSLASIYLGTKCIRSPLCDKSGRVVQFYVVYLSFSVSTCSLHYVSTTRLQPHTQRSKIWITCKSGVGPDLKCTV